MLFQHSGFTTRHIVKAAPESNENSCKREEEWWQAEQTCLCIENYVEISRDRALVHSSLSDFCPQEGTAAKSLCFLFCTWNYFPKLPTQALHEARICQLCLMFWFFSVQSSVIHSRESVHTKKGDSAPTGRHVETVPCTSLLCGNGDSLQKHIIIIIIIIRNPDFIMEHFFSFLLSLSFFLPLNKVVVCNYSYYFFTSVFRSLSHVILFSACVRFDGSREGELLTVRSLPDCGFWFRLENREQDDRNQSREGCFSSWTYTSQTTK